MLLPGFFFLLCAWPPQGGRLSSLLGAPRWRWSPVVAAHRPAAVAGAGSNAGICRLDRSPEIPESARRSGVLNSGRIFYLAPSPHETLMPSALLICFSAPCPARRWTSSEERWAAAHLAGGLLSATRAVLFILGTFHWGRFLPGRLVILLRTIPPRPPASILANRWLPFPAPGRPGSGRGVRGLALAHCEAPRLIHVRGVSAFLGGTSRSRDKQARTSRSDSIRRAPAVLNSPACRVLLSSPASSWRCSPAGLRGLA